MRHRARSRTFTAAASLALLAACATNPATGKRQIMLVGEAQEIAMGQEADQEVASSLGLYPDDQDMPESRRGDGVLPISEAAVEAAKTPGTEVARTDLVGRESGPRGRWVLLQHRRRKPIQALDDADVAKPADMPDELHSGNPEGLSGRAS